MELLPLLEGPLFRLLLEEPALFQKVLVAHGTLAWPSGQDLDPDVLLDTEISRLRAGHPRGAMVAICQFVGMTICLCSRDDAPPHVHVMHGSDEAQVQINDGKILQGSLPRAMLGPLSKWLTDRRFELALEWVKASSGQQPDPVPPP
jgi:hypothetical protein